MTDNMSLLGILACTLTSLNRRTGLSELVNVIRSIDHGEWFGERPLTIGKESGEMVFPGEMTTPSSMNVVWPKFDRLLAKRRRLNRTGRQYGESAELKLMDLADDVVGIIMCELIGGEIPVITRPRQLRNLLLAYPFMNTSPRRRWIFSTRVCCKIHTLDVLYPLSIEEQVKITPRHARPENIAFLAKMAGDALRVVRVPRFIDLCIPNEGYQRYQRNRTQYLISTLARHCSKLTEITFQDSGAIDNGVGKLFFTRNPGLKKIQVDAPGADFLRALAESECAIEDLILLRVQTPLLDSLKRLLSVKGSTLRLLGIETCFPLDSKFHLTPAEKARCRRREKAFIESLEKLIQTEMTSLRTLNIQPERRAIWFKQFTRRFQRLGKADLVIGDEQSKVFCPAVKNGETPKSYFSLLSMDQLMACDTPVEFHDFMDCLHKPDTLSIMRSSFTYVYGSERDNSLEYYVRTALSQKGGSVKRILMLAPLPRLQMYEMFLETISELLNILEENAGDLKQIEELHIPIHIVVFLARGIGYERFFGRLSHLKVLHFVKTHAESDVTAVVPKSIPAFLRGLMNSCPEFECLYISYPNCTKMRPDERCEQLSRVIEDAMIAVNEYEEVNPTVDVSTLRRQINLWI